MRRVPLLAIPVFAAVALLGGPTSARAADDTKTARGTVTAVTPDSVTVKIRDREMKFDVDAKTMVIAAGAGTRQRKAAAAGKAGTTLTETIKTGQAVEVTYHDMNGTYHAAEIRAIASAGAGSLSEDTPAAKTTMGTVKSVAADSLTVTGSSGKDMTFTVDAKTTVVGKGLGTKAAAKGGKTVITELVSSGDKVTVTYHDMGGSMHAATVNVTSKAMK